MYIKSYKELIVWQKSMLLVKEIYVLTEKLPRAEIYGLTSQMRRAAVSIPSNIAEGYGRRSTKDYAHFYSIAYGSALELETQLLISNTLDFVTEDDMTSALLALEEVLKMLNVMHSKVKELSANS